MPGLSTSAARDAWLVALIEAFDFASHKPVPVNARILADVERHLRRMAQSS